MWLPPGRTASLFVIGISRCHVRVDLVVWNAHPRIGQLGRPGGWNNELYAMISSPEEQAERHALLYPSLLQQAVNATHAVGAVVAGAVRGEPVSVPQEEQDRRLAICHACEFWDAAQERCSKCGCFGQWKTWLGSQKCPIGKW